MTAADRRAIVKMVKQRNRALENEFMVESSFRLRSRRRSSGRFQYRL